MHDRRSNEGNTLFQTTRIIQLFHVGLKTRVVCITQVWGRSYTCWVIIMSFFSLPLRNAVTGLVPSITASRPLYSYLYFSSFSGPILLVENFWQHLATDSLLFLVKKIHLHLNLLKVNTSELLLLFDLGKLFIFFIRTQAHLSLGDLCNCLEQF